MLIFKAPSVRRLAPFLALVLLCLSPGSTNAQLPESEERLKILTDPDSVKKALEKEKTRPPIELFRSQVAPFDILPFVKANHWSTISLELRANYSDYAGLLQTAPVRLAGLPQEIIYRRDARLAKTQRSRLSQQVMLPLIPKDLNLELIQPNGIRPDELWQATLRVLEPNQMLLLFLTKDPSDVYAGWNRYQALYPHNVERGDVQELDRRKYYRLVLPLDLEKPPLSSHPLCWTTISHVVWDGMAPDTLNPSQQQALLDWLHWGGQLILMGGAGPSLSSLKDSFLSPYLPADLTGENALLTRDDLKFLSNAYPPPLIPMMNEGDDEKSIYETTPGRRLGELYRAPVPIIPPPDRPVFLSGLKPLPGAVSFSLDPSSKRLIGVESRVGRGRVLMLGFSLTDPTIASWPGLDTFIRRVVLRRPEEALASREPGTARRPGAARYSGLPGPDLSWLRYLSRDIVIPEPKNGPKWPAPAPEPTPPKRPPSAVSEVSVSPDDETYIAPAGSVAAWSDNASLPRLSRAMLEEASGIKIPSAGFVLKVVIAYILALVPLNWLICRYLLRRRELAWVSVPILAFAFAIGVERAAAYDMGYNSACDEFDVLETYGGYSRAHVSRFVSLYSTGRTRYNISFPNDPTALALPLDNGRSLRGEDIVTSTWQSYPVPTLEGFLVQPRSLAMFRAEQMISLAGRISLKSDNGVRTIVNQSGLALQDAVLVDLSAPANIRETYLGAIASDGEVEIKEVPRDPPAQTAAETLRPERFLQAFREAYEARPENRGELRLVAWTPSPLPGQKVEPAVDRHRGFTAVVVHLKLGDPPSPDERIYNSVASVPQRFKTLLDSSALSTTPQPIRGSTLGEEHVAPAPRSLTAQPKP